jgi:hypothetical protein
MDAHEVDRILDGARATWKAANERDEALARKASERRLLEDAPASDDGEERIVEAASARARLKMRDAIPIMLCAIACVVIGLLLRNGSVPKESIRPEALLAPPPISTTREPAETPTSQAAAGTSTSALAPLPSLPRPTTTPELQRSAPPASTLPQLPPPTKVDPPSDTRLVGPAPKSIKSLYDEPPSTDDAVERARRKVPRHPRVPAGDRREWSPPVLSAPPIKPTPVPDPPRGRGRRVHRL